ncbi:MAG: SpoIIE family protein phosphatase [Myxococcales bacterium]|nr:SpoIIE family protein phosphatase [Myxococcales bacterium]
MSAEAPSGPESVPLRHRFGLQLLGWLLVAALVPAAAVGAISSSVAQDALEKELRGRLVSVVERDAERLDSWARRRRAEVRALSRAADVRAALARAASGDSAAGAELAGRLRLHSEALEFTNLLVVASDGSVLCSTESSTLVGRRVNQGPLERSELARVFDRARLLGESEFSDFSTRRLAGDAVDNGSGTPRALVGAAVFDAGRVSGVVVAELDDREVQRSAQSLVGFGAGGSIDIVGYAEGRAVYVTSSRTSGGGSFRRALSLESASLESEALRGGRGDGTRADGSGRQTFAVWRYVPSLRWGIVSQVDEAEAFAPVRRLRALSIALGSLAALFAALIAAWGSRRVSGPVASLIREANRVTSGDLSTRVRVEGKGELAMLAQVFNGMVAELQRNTEGLEGIVAARTRQLTENNARIRESIDLARKIESSMLPDGGSLPPSLKKAALVWRPLDQVGGDLAFVEPTPDGGFVAGVIDCTGHGVAAAMTAMFATAMCSLAIATHGSKGPAEVLRELDRRLERAFDRARGDGISLGMDVALVAARPGEPLRFSGAGVGLFARTSDNKFTTISGRRVGLGYGARRKQLPLEEHTISIDELDSVILFTDGVLDEPQGTRGEGLGRTRLLAMLEARSGMDIDKLLATIDAEVIAGRGERPQRDDVTVLGLSINRTALVQSKGAA